MTVSSTARLGGGRPVDFGADTGWLDELLLASPARAPPTHTHTHTRPALWRALWRGKGPHTAGTVEDQEAVEGQGQRCCAHRWEGHRDWEPCCAHRDQWPPPQDRATAHRRGAVPNGSSRAVPAPATAAVRPPQALVRTRSAEEKQLRAAAEAEVVAENSR